MEGFRSDSKNRLYQYRGIPGSHSRLYLKETEFRINNENRDLFSLISSLFVTPVPDST